MIYRNRFLGQVRDLWESEQPLVRARGASMVGGSVGCRGPGVVRETFRPPREMVG